MENLKRVLVPVHGSKIDDEAIRLACSLSRRNKAKVYAIYVIEVGRTLPLNAQIGPDLDKGEKTLEHAEIVAEEDDYQIETDLLQARDAGAAIVDEAAERGVDIIVMGAEYKKRFGEFDYGRTVPYVFKNAPCRVLLLREVMG